MHLIMVLTRYFSNGLCIFCFIRFISVYFFYSWNIVNDDYKRIVLFNRF